MTRSLPPDWDGDRQPDDGGDPPGNLAPTDWKVILVAALCGAALGWFALSIYKINDTTVPILPWSLPTRRSTPRSPQFNNKRWRRPGVARTGEERGRSSRNLRQNRSFDGPRPPESAG